MVTAKNAGWETFLRRMFMDGDCGEYIGLVGPVNIFDISVTVVSSLGEEALTVYPTVIHSEEEAEVSRSRQRCFAWPGS